MKMNLRVFWSRSLVLLLLLTIHIATNCQAKTNINKAVIEDISDIKDFKKLLRTRTNVLVLFVSNTKNFPIELKTFRDAAEAVRGFGTLVLIKCEETTERKKLCKKLKIALTENYIIKHYKDGEFHKNYDRQMSVTSIVNFMRDPTGDLPWEEDKTSKNVLHFTNHNAFTKYFIKDTRPMMVMFYVPWCGYCKRLKPMYSEAATELKKQGLILAALDLERQENAPLRRAFNITGFPTLIYFEHGQKHQIYEGENTKEAIIAFMQNPKEALSVPKVKEPDWSSDANSEVVHLTDKIFDAVIKDEKSVLVMFYAPWCEHCKYLKPEYEKAASIMKSKKIPGVLAAIDATIHGSVVRRYNVNGYPTLKYFANGEFKFNVNYRTAEKLIEFMREPKEPTPPPVVTEKSWEAEEGNEGIVFLNEQTFKTTLKRKKYALVMFYAPWCGHCKITKPEFAAAAQAFLNDTRVLFGAVDCTIEKNICNGQNIDGYPTIKYFSYLKIEEPYTDGRTKEEFVQFMKQMEKKQKHNQEL